MRTHIFVICTMSILLIGFKNITAQIPQGAIFPSEKILLKKASETHPYAAARFDVATLKNDNKPNDGFILVNYVKVMEEDLNTGEIHVIAQEDYSGSGPLGSHEGGLYPRNPRWYTPNTPSPLNISFKENGLLKISAGKRPDMITHFWSTWVRINVNTRHMVEIELFISGKIGFQAGLDYCNNSYDCHPRETHLEAFVSKWYGDTKGKFITIRYPDYEKVSRFGQEHYGVTAEGTYFISKELVDFLQADFVEIRCGATSWNPRQMHLEGIYYKYRSNVNVSDKMLYCFRLNKSEDFHVPAARMEIFDPQDYVDNSKGGANFFTYPVNSK